MEMWNLLSAQARSWLDPAFLVCLFWVALIKPERIRSLLAFRLACVLFAVSVIAPTLVNLYLFGDRPVRQPNRLGAQDPGAGLYLSVISPLLFMISFILAMDTVIPWRRQRVVQGVVQAGDEDGV